MDFDNSLDIITPDVGSNTISIGGSGSIRIPTGTSGQRPGSSLEAGMLRFNTDTSIGLEVYNGSIWQSYQIRSANLDSLSGISSNGFVSRNGTTFNARSIVVPSSGISITNADGVSGNPTLALGNDLGALENLSTTGVAVRTSTDNWTTRTITAGTGISVSNGNGVSGNPTITLATLADGGTGSFLKITRDTYGRISGTSAVGSSDITTALGFTPISGNADNLTSGYIPAARFFNTPGAYTIDPTFPKTNQQHSTLDGPTIGEIALEDSYVSNKIQFRIPASIEYTTNGTTWITHPDTPSTYENLFVGYDKGTRIHIQGPSQGNWAGLRMTFTAETEYYVFLDYLYFFNSTNGHNCTIKIEKSFGSSTTTWETVVDSSSFTTWPGHTMVPHDTIRWNGSPTDGVHSKHVRITWTPSWNGALPTNNIMINNINWYGAFPANPNPQIFHWEFNKDVTFPRNVICTETRSSNVNITHSSSTRNSDTVFYSSTDDYVRKNNAGGFRSSLDVYSKSEVNLRTPKSITILDVTSSEKIIWFFNPASWTVSEIRSVVLGSSPSVTFQVRYGTSVAVAGTQVASVTTTNTTTGVSTTTFSNATIPTNNFVWITTSAKSGTVDQMNITII